MELNERAQKLNSIIKVAAAEAIIPVADWPKKKWITKATHSSQ